ncbi:MAG: DNA polymerase III subunit delta [Bacteroidota bacterium]
MNDPREHISRDIETGRILPAYLLCGEEDFLIEEAEKELVEALLSAEQRGFNLDVVHGGECDVRAMVALASSFPMMADRRVVILKDAEKACATDQDRALLTAYLDRPLESTCLILLAQKPDLRRRPYTSIRKNGRILEFRPLPESRIPPWIIRRAREQGREIDQDAARRLAALTGGSLRELQSELDKLYVFIGERKAITEADLAAATGSTRGAAPWALQEALGRGDHPAAAAILENLLGSQEKTYGVIPILTKYFTALWKLRSLPERISDRKAVMDEIGVFRPEQLRGYYDAFARFGAARIEEAFSILAEADERLKTGHGDPPAVLHEMLAGLLGPSPSSRGGHCEGGPPPR